MTVSRLPVLGFGLLLIVVLCTQAQPFASLLDYGVLDDPTQSNSLRRNLTLLLLAGALWQGWREGQGRLLWQAVSPGLIGIFVWFGMTALISGSAGLALNRLALAGVVIALAVSLPLLLRSLDEFILLLGLAASLAVLLSFGGALFIPDLAIHSLRDTVEQGLAGDWRGVFRHKNDLAPMTIHFCFIGLLLWRVGLPVWGGLVMVASLALLGLSGGKSAALLLLPAGLAASAILAMRTQFGMGMVALFIVGGLVALTVGSVALPVLGALTAHLPDPSFTGRSDIWQLGWRLSRRGQSPAMVMAYSGMPASPIRWPVRAIRRHRCLMLITAISRSPLPLACRDWRWCWLGLGSRQSAILPAFARGHWAGWRRRSCII